MFLNYSFTEEVRLNYKELDSIEVPTKAELKYIIEYELQNSLNDEDILKRVGLYLGVRRAGTGGSGAPCFSTSYGTCAPYER